MRFRQRGTERRVRTHWSPWMSLVTRPNWFSLLLAVKNGPRVRKSKRVSV